MWERRCGCYWRDQHLRQLTFVVTAEETCVVRVDVLSRQHFLETHKQIIDSQYDEKYEGCFVVFSA